ncbi:hypothetical protein [Mycolicibacterium sp.]|uniref:hypothetical protein n=1 Tax=Mycolicibacterium sp. TaxID=2320850 RepID=UPI00355CCC1E
MHVVLHTKRDGVGIYASAMSSDRRTSSHLLRQLSVAATALILCCTATPAAHAAPAPSGPWVAIAGVYGTEEPVAITAGDRPQPGVTIASQVDARTSRMCTISWPVVSANDDVGYLTAGHCQTRTGAPLWMFTDKSSGSRMFLSPLQNRERGVDKAGIVHDTAVFFLTSDQQERDYGIAVAPRVRVRGVLSTSEVRALPRGTPMCMNGARSGVTCGPLLRAGSSEVQWGGSAIQGDSGAPVFVVDAAGDAMAVGMLASGPSDTENYVTYLAPVLTRLKLRVLVESGDA